jgi:hypothetical protein
MARTRQAEESTNMSESNPRELVGQLVEVGFVSLNDTPSQERLGWLRDVTDEGIIFAKAFYSDSLLRRMPEKDAFFPWAFVSEIHLYEDRQHPGS